MDDLKAKHREMSSKSPDTRANGLTRFLQAVSPYDAETLAAALAGLTVLPENADSQLRLESMIDAVASRLTSSTLVMTAHRLRSLCTGRLSYELVAPLEDPAEFPVTETLVFGGHAYTVFTGQGEDVAFVCERLFSAIADLADDHAEPEIVDATGLIRLALTLSDQIAARAGVPANLRPRGNGPIHVPTGPVHDLASPVSWSAAEIEVICERARSNPDAIKPLTVPMGRVSAQARADDDRFTFKPFLRCEDESLVVRPGQILQALGEHLVELAVARGRGRELAERYAIKIRDSAIESAFLLGATPILSPLVPSAIPSLFEDLFRIDDDAAMILVTVGDVLDPFDPADSEDQWFPSKELEARLDLRFREIVAQVRALGPYREVLFCVVPAVPPGRPYAMHEAELEDAAESILLTPAALEVIAFHEHDPLTLWRFARSVRLFQLTSMFISFNPLDLFAAYRSNDHTFYLSDGPRPKGVSITPGTGMSLRLDMLEKRRRQSAEQPQDAGEIEVISASSEGLPIYVPRRPWGQPTRLVRLADLDTWVLGEPFVHLPPELATFSERLVEAVAYWVWRTASVILAGRPADDWQRQVVSLFVAVENPTGWRQIEASAEDGDLDFDLDRKTLSIKLTVRPTWQGTLAKPDNEGERHLAWVIGAALIDLLVPDQTSRERLVEVVEQAAPLGRRKQLLTMETSTASMLGPDTGVPPWRAASDWERGEIRDALAAAYQDAGFAPGPAGDTTEQNRIIQFAVGFFLTGLVAAVSELSHDGLVEMLMRREEGLLLASARQELLIPTRIACYGDVADVVTNLAQETRDISQASIAHRFLIEYVAACPPDGTQSLSTARYDHLLALAAGIVEYGFQSDVTHYGLDDVQARILPSGRLGIRAGRYEAASARWATGMTLRQIDWAHERFDEHWEQASDEPVMPPQGWQEAFRAEFGYSATDLRAVLDELADLAGEGEGSVAAWSRDALLAELARRIERQATDVEPVVSALTLGPRPNFLKPVGVAKEEVYPWRFNRQLSLLRRPLVARSDDLVWGRRMIVAAARHIVNLIGTDRLAAHSPEMRALKSKISTRSGQEFESEVVLEVERCGLAATRRVKKLGKARLADGGNDLGDIDVLAIDRSRKVVWAIECKALSAARTPWELASELKDFSDGRNGVPARHGRRLAWLRSHRAELAAASELGDLRGWRIEALIVVEVDLLAVHLQQISMPVVDVHSLEAILAPRAKTVGMGARRR
jgi:hypothetical protein